MNIAPMLLLFFELSSSFCPSFTTKSCISWIVDRTASTFQRSDGAFLNGIASGNLLNLNHQFWTRRNWPFLSGFLYLTWITVWNLTRKVATIWLGHYWWLLCSLLTTSQFEWYAHRISFLVGWLSSLATLAELKGANNLLSIVPLLCRLIIFN